MASYDGQANTNVQTVESRAVGHQDSLHLHLSQQNWHISDTVLSTVAGSNTWPGQFLWAFSTVLTFSVWVPCRFSCFLSKSHMGQIWNPRVTSMVWWLHVFLCGPVVNCPLVQGLLPHLCFLFFLQTNTCRPSVIVPGTRKWDSGCHHNTISVAICSSLLCCPIHGCLILERRRH